MSTPYRFGYLFKKDPSLHETMYDDENKTGDKNYNGYEAYDNHDNNDDEEYDGNDKDYHNFHLIFKYHCHHSIFHPCWHTLCHLH